MISRFWYNVFFNCFFKYKITLFVNLVCKAANELCFLIAFLDISVSESHILLLLRQTWTRSVYFLLWFFRGNTSFLPKTWKFHWTYFFLRVLWDQKSNVPSLGKKMGRQDRKLKYNLRDQSSSADIADSTDTVSIGSFKRKSSWALPVRDLLFW